MLEHELAEKLAIYSIENLTMGIGNCDDDDVWNMSTDDESSESEDGSNDSENDHSTSRAPETEEEKKDAILRRTRKIYNHIVSLSPSGDGVDAKGLETFFLEIGLEDGVYRAKS